MKYDIKKMQRLYEEWQSSGLSKVGFCKQHGIRSNTFHYWIKKILKEDPKATEGKGFSEISVTQPFIADQKQPVAVINFPSGTSLELFFQVEASYLKDLLQ